MEQYYIPALYGLGVLTLILAGACVFLFQKMAAAKQESGTKAMTLAASVGGYYYYDVPEQSEHFSINLVSMFHLPKDITTLKQFVIEIDDYNNELMNAFYALKEQEIPQFSLNIRARVRGKYSNIYCIGTRVHKADGELLGVIIWFYDTTHFNEQIERIQIDQKLYEKRVSELEVLLDSLPFPVWKINASGQICYANKSYRLISDDEDSSTLFDDEPREIYPDMIEDAAYCHSEAVPLHKKRQVIVDGERRLFDITLSPEKKPSVVIGWALDMTQYQELQDKLRRHVSAHSDLLESSSSAMAVYSANTQLQYYNQAFVKLWDLKEEWLDTHPTFSEVLEKLREKRKLPEQADFKAFRDQQLQWFKDLVQPHNEFYYLPDGKELRVIVIPHALGGILFAYEDMTDRLAMERSYNTLLAVQRETLDNLREGIAVFGQNGRLELYNPSYSSLWPYDDEFLKGKPHISELIEKAKDMFMYDGDWQAFKSSLVVEATQRKNIIRRFSLSNGKCIDSLIIPLPDGRNMQSYMDVTDSIIAEKNLKERNVALEEADRVKTEFLANVSYELRTPLTTILGFSEALEHEYFGKMSQEQHAYVQGIYESSSHLMSLINNILDLTSIEAGYLTLDMQEFNVYHAVSSIVDLLQARVKEVGLTLTLNGGEKAGTMCGDEKRIKQVVFNMLSNAIKFTNEGGTVKVGVSGTKKDIKVWVEDTGIGIDEDEIPHIFERFYKTRAAQHKDKTGTGLGLSLVKNMVEMHGGEVEVSSEIGKGTTITCTFPRVSQKMVPVPAEIEESKEA